MAISKRDRWLLILAVGIGMILAFYLLDDFWPKLAESPVGAAVGEAVAERARPKRSRPAAAAHAVPVEEGGEGEEGDEGADDEGEE